MTAARPALLAWAALTLVLFTTMPSSVLSQGLVSFRGRQENGPPPRWRVFFDTGSSFDVLHAFPDDVNDLSAAYTRLVLVGGGTLRVPSERIRRLIELELPPNPPSVALRVGVARWRKLVEQTAARHELDPDFVAAVIDVESGGNPRAVSHAGAVGLMQLLPATALDYGLTNLTDPATNIEAGCRHLARLRRVVGQDRELLLAAYNAGEGAVARFGGVPAFTETRRYVRAVLARLPVKEVSTAPGEPGD